MFKIFSYTFLLFLVVLAIETLIFWGLGCLVIWLFKIKFTWTILHGLAIALIYRLIK